LAVPQQRALGQLKLCTALYGLAYTKPSFRWGLFHGFGPNPIKTTPTMAPTLALVLGLLN